MLLQPGRDARRVGMQVHDRAACRRQHYTTSLSRQARKPVVHLPWNGYICSNEGTPPYEVRFGGW
ncbi:MAG TPA: hypothetical protein P5547_12630 [Spirochaetota bacterium]|nr:hypothetical protein [Spirochaetota bacterium]HPD06070.1 hypothetical protein [Spirochaetota bacterium]HRR61768.1 hypothetical protein [Spirochaetota bacterium]